MSIATSAEQRTTGLEALFVRLRARIRRYLFWQGLALSAATAVLVFVAALLIDWLFEPAEIVRRGLLAAGVLAVAGVFSQLVVRRLAVPLPDSRLALLLERRFPEFQDSLLTAVDLAQPDRQLGDLAQEMFAHTYANAVEQAATVDLDQVLLRGPLLRALAAAGVLLTALGIFAVTTPETLRFGVRRLAGVTDELWPRRTRLTVPGFIDGIKVVGKGEDVDVLVQADMSMPLVPEVVQIRYQSEEGMRGRETMIRTGTADPQRDAYQDFHHTFAGVLSSLTFDVAGGDARLRGLQVRAVENPTINAATLYCEYPEYMGRSARELRVTGSMQIPLGTRVTVRVQANKDLVRALVRVPAEDGNSQSTTITLPGTAGSLRNFEFALPPLARDTTLEFTLHDTDGIHNRKPFTVALSAQVDEPPELSLRLAGIGTSITPQARLPLQGTIRDDYGVAAAAFRLVVDQQEPRIASFGATPAGATEVDVDDAYEVRDLGLKVGQTLQVGGQASDGYFLAEGDQPHLAIGERFQLEVVSPETLRSQLESRELNLRQRFEATLKEVTDTRDSLATLEFKKNATAAAAPQADDAAAAPDKADPSSPAPPDLTKAAVETASADKLRVERARQNAEKNAQETLGIAVAFDEIREELINNRVDIEELKIRLKDHIADPLRTVGETMFPELDRLLKELAADLNDPARAHNAQQSATAQADAILVVMEQVRDKMLELETFNEAIDMLRAIIDSEKSLQEKVRERQKRKVRDLLEDDSP